MKTLIAFLSTALLAGALTAQAASSTTITQSKLPFTISTPGTYILTDNLSYTSGSSLGAININEPIEGPVIVDLKGFTITGSGANSSNVGVSITEETEGTNTYPVTIRNGTIANFATGVDDFQASNVTVKNVVFNKDGGIGVAFDQFVDSSTVNNCTFNSCGIYDYVSTGGNSYNNNTFVNADASKFTGLQIYSYCCSTPLVLNRCQFAPPPATSLLTSAIAAPAAPKSANIPISSLPFAITAPGTYILTGNLSYIGGGTNPAIAINGTIAGPVILDLKGFTLTSDYGTDSAPCISISEGNGLYPITIRNGTITMFEEGVLANSVSNITVNKVVLEQNALGVYFISVDSSTIYNCTFHLNSYGIEDRQSTGGNRYNNNTFGLGGGLALYVQSQFQSTFVLDRCDFAPPPTP